MRIARFLCFFGLAVGVLLGLSPSAQADLVTYSTVGKFAGGDSPGSSTYVDGEYGISIAFNSEVGQTVNVPPTSQVTFGTFHVTAPATLLTQTAVSSPFELDIFQSTPTIGGPVVFAGSLTGTLAFNNSQAYVQFNPPLTGSIGPVIYKIVSQDGGVLGRVNLAPPTTNNGNSTIAGTIGIIPEPSSLVLSALLAPALLALVAHTRRSVHSSRI
jgi:hypothetical protein